MELILRPALAQCALQEGGLLPDREVCNQLPQAGVCDDCIGGWGLAGGEELVQETLVGWLLLLLELRLS